MVTKPKHAWVTTPQVSSLRVRGVTFQLYPHDHDPPHAHGTYCGAEAIVDLNDNRTVSLSQRRDAVSPPNAKASAIRRILQVAQEHFDELVTLWEKMHS